MTPCIGLGALFTFLPSPLRSVRPSLLAPFIPDYRFRIAAHQSKAPRVATRREPFPSGIILLWAFVWEQRHDVYQLQCYNEESIEPPKPFRVTQIGTFRTVGMSLGRHFPTADCQFPLKEGTGAYIRWAVCPTELGVLV